MNGVSIEQTDERVGSCSDTDASNMPGVIAELGDLKPAAIVTEAGLAHLFNRHAVSIKRAVQRGELPPPCKLFGANVWTAGVLIRYIESRLEQASAEAAAESKRLEKLSPVSR